MIEQEISDAIPPHLVLTLSTVGLSGVVVAADLFVSAAGAAEYSRGIMGPRAQATVRAMR